ncbi:BQ5605_C014g07441 [Microbotryum silenes-dioicae]|uniref:BQ5605_C014g07441 protein n=1 Tax=Microbotryum silenes-dioicae TaxID=796604 RepID=A0A2X0NXY0_9BASI|nr:BQ5605_C014g07441 [Microbotryum silenes-dioicae]
MSSNRLWSAEEKADYGQWPLILGDRRKADEWTLMDNITILRLPLYMATEEHEWTACKYERCLAVIETSHGAPSISFHQHPADHLTLCPVLEHSIAGTKLCQLFEGEREKRLNIVPFLTARAEGPIPRVTGGSDRPTIPYAEWERVIVKPRVPKKGDLMPRTEFMRQPDGNACGVFVCQTMEMLVAAVAFQSELDWSWSPLKPLQDNFYADQRAYMLDVVKHARLPCDTELEANSDPPPLDLREGTGAPPPVPEAVPLALKESSPELEEKCHTTELPHGKTVEKLSFVKLKDESNYASWHRKMTLLFMGHKVVDIVLGVKPKPLPLPLLEGNASPATVDALPLAAGARWFPAGVTA